MKFYMTNFWRQSRLQVESKLLNCYQVEWGHLGCKSPTSSRPQVTLGSSGVRLTDQSSSQV